MFRKLALVFTVGLVLAFAGVVVAQQVTGNISGTVKDSSGAVVPNATVIITNTDKNVVVRTTKTSDVGQYSAPLLPVGHYAVAVEANGFTKMSQNNIALNVNDNLTVDFSLQVGGTQQTVTVEAAPLTVDLQNAQAQTVITGTQIRELAVNTRNYEQLVTLMPGVSTGITSDQLYVRVSNPVGKSNQINFSINGGRSTQNEWNIDGADNVDRGANLTLAFLSKFGCDCGIFGSARAIHRGIWAQLRRANQCHNQVRNQRFPRRPVRILPQRCA